MRLPERIEISVDDKLEMAVIRKPKDQQGVTALREAVELATMNWGRASIEAGPNHPDHQSQPGISNTIGQIRVVTPDHEQPDAISAGWLKANIIADYNNFSLPDDDGFYAEQKPDEKLLPENTPIVFALAEAKPGMEIIIAIIPPGPLTGRTQQTWWALLPGQLPAPTLTPPEEAQLSLYLERNGFIVAIGAGGVGSSFMLCHDREYAGRLTVALLRSRMEEEGAASRYGLQPDEITFFKTHTDEEAIIARWNTIQKNNERGFTITITPKAG